MTKLRYSMDGKRMLPTESETFTDDDGAKLLIEVGKYSEEDFYIKLGSGYLSNFTINAYRNEITGEDSCIIRGNGEKKSETLQRVLGGLVKNFKNNLN